MYQDMFRYGPYYRREKSVIEEEVIPLTEALDIIRSSIMDESNDEVSYQNLLNNAPNESAKKIIQSIIDDENRHNEILRYVYSSITGEEIMQNNSMQNNSNINYNDGIVKALFDESGAIKKYRKVMSAMPNNKMYALVMSILTDEIRHMSLVNYLIHSAG